MTSFGTIIRELRENRGLVLRQVGAALDIDQAIISKYEKGERKPNREQVLAFEKFFGTKPNELLIAWLSDKVVYQLEDEDVALKALQVAEERIKYIRKKRK
ncbi:MAG: helix-turn-helix transcriptional regulator [Chitinophagaceae bacterium]|nr:helix-turn-helix transcriptional regulator [Chitinophagaceae bacterium]